MITIFTLILFMAGLTVMFAALMAWKNRGSSGGMAMCLMFVSIAVWSCFSALETTSTSDSQRYLWSALSYLGVCNVAPLLFVFAVEYSESRWRLSARLLAAIWSVPVVTMVLAFTNGSHHLIWTAITPGPIAGSNIAIYHHGAWFLVEMLWFLMLSVVASFHLLRMAFHVARIYVFQAIVLLACVVITWVGLLLFLLPNGPVPGLDTTSLGFAASAVLIMAAHRRLKLLDLVPQARSMLVENMPEGLIVLDLEGRVIDVNPTAARLLGTDSSVLGRALADALPRLSGLVEEGEAAGIREMSLSTPDGRTLEVLVSDVNGRAGRRTGRLLLIHDISERTQAAREREKLIAELSEALSNVRKLSGLLPICASCKKIRDDRGYWHQVESFMHDHSDVEFSHGICPDCMAKLYPELGGG